MAQRSHTGLAGSRTTFKEYAQEPGAPLSFCVLLFDRQLTVGHKFSNLTDVKNRTHGAHAAAGIEPIVSGWEIQNEVSVAPIG